MWARLAAAINLRHASRVARMGLKHRQLGGVLGAYFRGVEVPALAANLGTSDAQAALKSFIGGTTSMGTGATRVAAGIGAGLAGVNILGGNDVTAGIGAAGAYAGAYGALGYIPKLRTGVGGGLARAAGGLMAGSIAWQGLRGPRMSDYQ